MKNLTFRYSVTQFSHWAASSGAAAFATTYLLEAGMAPGAVGLLLALAGLASCFTQPILAGLADRAKDFILVRLLLGLSVFSGCCYGMQLIPGLPLWLIALCYGLGIWSSDVMSPLLNALNVAYNEGGYPINYGVARSLGSVATAVSNLVLGYVLARLGSRWMLVFLLVPRLCSIGALAGFPTLSRVAAGEKAEDTTSIPVFFRKYPVYCVCLLGIAFLGMYHAMTENYLIAILGALGGDSSHVGRALFISAMVGAPVIFCFSKIRTLARDTTLLKIAALSFLIKAVCFCFAGSITTIYFLQLLQITSYGLLAPAQVYYAQARVNPSDMVKGQAFITAAYALGCSGGNFAGGQLLGIGVRALLLAGVAMALAGTCIVFATVNRPEKAAAM